MKKILIIITGLCFFLPITFFGQKKEVQMALQAGTTDGVYKIYPKKLGVLLTKRTIFSASTIDKYSSRNKKYEKMEKVYY
jgi:hypothetical protein